MNSEAKTNCINCNKAVNNTLLCDDCFFTANGITRQQWLKQLEAEKQSSKNTKDMRLRITRKWNPLAEEEQK